MTYPQAPWTLQGYAIGTLNLIDSEPLRSLIPPELDIISIFPGKTLGGVYLASYQQGSVLEYNELIIAAGLVSYSGKIGSWVTHIYVDNSDSVAGGREVWGLPKELAEFTWKQDESQFSVIVRQGNRQLCNLSYTRSSLGWRLPFTVSFFSALDSNFLEFKGQLESQIKLVSSKLAVPPESPFANLNLSQPWLTGYCEDMRIQISAPEVIGNRAVEFSYG